jgi:hypothetical protein
MAKSRSSPKRAPAARPRRRPPREETPPAAPPASPEPPEPRFYSDEEAERVFTELPRLDESLAVVRYTGRKRAYIHYGRADGSAFWYLIRSDGPRLLKLYPAEQTAECFSELLAMMEGWRASVNSDPMSPSYCEIEPGEEVIERTMRERYLGLAR